MVQLCYLNAQKRKKFHWMLLCSFYLKIFFFRYRPLSTPKFHLHFLQKACFLTAPSKVRFYTVRWMHRRGTSFTDCFCVVFIWTYSFFHYRPLSALNVHLHLLQKECLRTAPSKVWFNSVTWMHRRERSFTECFCVVFIWRYSYLHYRPLSAPNVHLHFLQKECFRTAQSKLRFSSVSWMHRTERSFTEWFCVVSIWRYSFFH